MAATSVEKSGFPAAMATTVSSAALAVVLTNGTMDKAMAAKVNSFFMGGFLVGFFSVEVLDAVENEWGAILVTRFSFYI